MAVNSITETVSGREVKLSAVYSSDPNSPNYSYSQATPSADLRLFVTNPAAYEQFKVGQHYDLIFTPIDG